MLVVRTSEAAVASDRVVLAQGVRSLRDGEEKKYSRGYGVRKIGGTHSSILSEGLHSAVVPTVSSVRLYEASKIGMALPAYLQLPVEGIRYF